MYAHKRTDRHTHKNAHTWSADRVRTAADWNAKLEQINMMASMIQLSLRNPFCSGPTGQRIVMSHVTVVLRWLGLFWYTSRLLTHSNIFSITNKVTGTLLSLSVSPFSVNRKIKTFMGQRPSLKLILDLKHVAFFYSQTHRHTPDTSPPTLSDCTVLSPW